MTFTFNLNCHLSSVKTVIYVLRFGWLLLFDCISRYMLLSVSLFFSFTLYFNRIMSLQRVVGFLLLKSCLMAFAKTLAFPLPSF